MFSDLFLLQQTHDFELEVCFQVNIHGFDNVCMNLDVGCIRIHIGTWMFLDLFLL